VSAAALSDVRAIAPNLKVLELSTGISPGAVEAPLPPGLTRLAVARMEDSGTPRLARTAPGLRALTVWDAPAWPRGSVVAMAKGHGALEEVSFERFDTTLYDYEEGDVERLFRVHDLACLGRLPRLRRLALLDTTLLLGAGERALAKVEGWARGWAGAPLEELRLVASHDGDPHRVSRARWIGRGRRCDRICRVRAAAAQGPALLGGCGA
jgi:hypothetical protein